MTKLLRTGLLFVAGVTISLVGGWSLRPDSAMDRGTPSSGSPVAVGFPYEEYVFVFIGSSVCGASNRPYLPDAVEVAKGKLAARAEADGARLHTIAVARDRSVSAGLEHLRKFGDFDEVTAGGGWANHAVNRYVYQTFPGPGVTPQVVVVKREVARGGGSSSPPQLVIRKVGAAEIRRWVVDQDAAMPDLSSHP